MKFRSFIAFSLLSLTTIALRCWADSSQDPTADPLNSALRKKDEALLDAVHRGNKLVWQDATTEDFSYVEDGEVTPRKEFLEGLAEDGLQALIIENYSVHRIGDTAMVMHVDGESPRPHQDVSKSHFVMTETWQLIGNEWKLRLVHVDRIRIDPPAISLTDSQIHELVGTYRSGTDTYVIHNVGDRIFGQRSGGQDVELKAETRDVLYIPDEFFLRKIFLRNAKEQVTSFSDRYPGSDRIWVHEN